MIKKTFKKEKYERIANLPSGHIKQTTEAQEVPRLQYKLEYLT
jgi:hypothetical protein